MRLRKSWRFVGTIGNCLLLGVAFFCSAEIASRVDDWATNGTRIADNPTFADLKIHDSYGVVRGTPLGRFKHLRLNEFGFRGKAIAALPAAGTCRIVVLGASEVFSPNALDEMTVPAHLDRLLNRNGRYEVVNGAIVGMTLGSMISYWEQWVAQFRPHVVLVYPTPHFYLHDTPSKPPTTDTSAPRSSSDGNKPFASRFVSRLRDMFDLPEFIETWKSERQIRALVAGKSTEWYFHTAPQVGMQHFAADLSDLVERIVAHGAQPVLVTHSVRSTTPPRPEDRFDLHEMRVFVPRATDEAILQFESAARTATIEIGAARKVPVIDLAASLNGRRDCFIDLVHFSDSGAAFVALLLSEQLPPLVRPIAQHSR